MAGAHRFLRKPPPPSPPPGSVQLPGWWTKPAARLGVKMTAPPRPSPGWSPAAAAASASPRSPTSATTWRSATTGPHRRGAGRAGRRSSRRWSGCAASGSSWTPRRLAAGLRLVGRQPASYRSASCSGSVSASTTADDDAAGHRGRRRRLARRPAGRRGRPRLDAVERAGGFTGTLRPYQERGSGLAGLPGPVGLGGVLADDMGLGKTVQLLACCSPADAGDERRADPAGLPDVAGRQLAAGGGAVRPGAAGARPPRRRAGPGRGVRRRPSPAPTWSSPPTRWPPATPPPAPRSTGAGWSSTRRRRSRTRPPSRPTAVRSLPGAAPDRGDRHAGGEPARRPVVDHGVRQPRPARAGARRSRSGYAEPIERHGDDEAADAAAAAHRPVRPAPAQDRQVDHLRPAGEAGDGGAAATSPPSRPRSTRRWSTTCWTGSTTATGIERRGLVLATMTKLKQVCNHPAHLLRDGSPAGRPVRQAGAAGRDPRGGARGGREGAGVHPVRRVRRDAARPTWRPGSAARCCSCTAACAKAERDAMVARFQADDRRSPPLFVLSLKAGGTGLNLTAANHVFHVDRWWNPAVEDQATDRAFRIGQTPRRAGPQVRLRRHAGGEDRRR